MEAKSLRELICRAQDPVRKSREILEEQYRKGPGVGEADVSASARFELLRSLIVQAAYEAVSDSDRTGWLDAGRIDSEHEDAAETRWYRLMDGISHYLKGVPEAVFSKEAKSALIALEAEAIGPGRMLGSVRSYVPGVGYAVSVRKRSGENQDSFAVLGGQGRKILGVADGCGSERFSAIASHLCMRELASRRGKEGIIQINGIIAGAMNTQEYLDLAGGAIASSTMLAAEIYGNSKRVYRVGDSIGFSSSDGIIHELADSTGLVHVVGYPGLREEQIEEFDEPDSQIILTSDGLTNYVNDAGYLLAKLVGITSDAVMIAERLLRAALTNQIRWNHADDITVVVEDTG